MSVLVGIWSLDGSPVERGFLARTSQTVATYTPDGEHTYFDASVGMLYRAFHTTSESRLEHQPHISDSGAVLTWDGRLDNRDELISQLRNNLSGDRTDVAIVAAAFDRHGAGCFAKLIGDWALAIWDPRDNQLFLARDYIGTRHLFYYPKPKEVIWCTHLGPLALCGDQFALSEEYIAGYLAFHPDADITPYSGIYSVPPGKFVHISGSRIDIRSYWTFNTHLKTRYKTDPEYEEHYRHLFRLAVRHRLRTDSPILSELSGGLDSSSIVCMADDILTNEGAETPRLDTFSYYDSNEPGEDDFAHLRTIEEKRGRRGLRVDLRGSGDSLPFEYSSFPPTPGFGSRAEIKIAISDIVGRHEYRAMLCGTGGDEMNGQPLDPRILMADLVVEPRPNEMAKQLMAWSLQLRQPLLHLFFQVVMQLLPISIRASLSRQGKLEPWVNRTFAMKQRLPYRQLEVVEGLGFWHRPSAQDAARTVATLARQLTYTSPTFIEQRYPYLDQHLVEFLTTIPLDQLLRPGQRRSLMRRSLAHLLPPEILSRKTKARAARCYAVTLERHWDEVERLFISPLSSRLGYVDGNKVHASLLAVKHGQAPTYILRLLKALSLEMWLRDITARGVIPVKRAVVLPASRD